MKIMKLLLASLLVVGSVQAGELRYHNHDKVESYAAGLLSGILIVSALEYKSKPKYVVYTKERYHSKHHKRFKKYHHKYRR